MLIKKTKEKKEHNNNNNKDMHTHERQWIMFGTSFIGLILIIHGVHIVALSMVV